MNGSSLPARAQTKIDALLDAEQQAMTLLQNTTRRISELHNIINLNPEGDNAAANGREVARLQAVQVEQQARHRLCAAINGSLRAWLEQLPAHAVLTDRKPIKPKPRENETLLAAVNRTRDGIAELTKEQFEVNQAGLPIDAMKAMAKRWVEEKARYRPRIRAGHDGGFSVSFDPAANFETSSKVDVGAVLSALDAPAMIRLLQKEIDAMPKPKLAMTPAEKAQRLAEIKTELFDLECKEEALIEKAEQQGQLIPRRPNSNIAAVLAITVSSRRRVAA